MSNDEMRAKMLTGQGFIAALDQSGGSTPKVLGLYGIGEDAWSTEEEMFALMHGMRARIMKSPAFTGARVLGAILFERTMDGEIDGKPTARYLWEDKNVIPFLKVDQGLADPAGDVRMMAPIGDLEALLDRAVANGIFGTKMRSVIDAATPSGIDAVVEQQFEIGNRIIDKGLVPILEPEVTITIEDKAEAEDLLVARLIAGLDAQPEGREVMLKLSLPTKANLFRPLIEHPRCLRVVALSGGYSREEANNLLSQNHGMIASFSRALAEGLSAQQTEDEFNATLDATIASIYRASVT